MPRRNSAVKKDVLPDPIYNSKVVTKLVNQVMESGKKGLAQRIVYGAFDIVKEKSGQEPLEVFTTALENIKPVLETKSRRVGGATYQVPMEIRPERRQTLAIRWMVSFAMHQLRDVMKCTEWLRLIRLLLTSAGNQT